MKEAFKHRSRPCARHPELVAGVPFRSLNAWPDLPISNASCSAISMIASRSASRFTARSRWTLGCTPDISRTSSTVDGDAAPVALSRDTGRGDRSNERWRTYRYGNITLLAPTRSAASKCEREAANDRRRR